MNTKKPLKAHGCMPRTIRRTLGAAMVVACCYVLLASCCLFVGGTSYKFTGTNIDYTVIKSMQLDKIANRAPYGWAPMEAMLNNKLQDLYSNRTRLQMVKRNGDLHVSGEITGYDQFNKAISADGYSSQVQLKMTVNVRFENKKGNVQWERQFSATTQYDATQSLSSVQESLVQEMVDDISDQIFNATVADW